MKFEEIFKEDGLYTTDDFVDGFCFEISNGCLISVQHTSKDDLIPIKTRALCHVGLFSKTYKKVYTRQSLFKS